MKCLSDLVAETTFGDDLLDQAVVALGLILFGFGPPDRPCRFKETRVDSDVGESAGVHNLVVRRVHGAGVAQTHVVLDASAVGHVRVTIEEHLSRQIV